MAPLLTVVMPTHNRWEQLCTALAALADQSLPRSDFDVIVVSDGSTDETDEAIEQGRAPLPVQLIRQHNQGPAAARNNGVAAATGEVVLFLDDDVVADPGCLAAHLEVHQQTEKPIVVIGPLLTPDDWAFQPWVLWEQRKLEGQYQAMADGKWSATARQFYTGNASLPRQLFLDAGGFDPTFLRGEDVELAYRLAEDGIEFHFDFDAKSFHYAQRSYQSWLSIPTAYGRNDAVMWRDHGRSWLLPTIRWEMRRRNPLTQIYTEIGLRSEGFARLTTRAALPVVNLAERLGLSAVTGAALSAIYNLSYYRALVEELGGREQFRAVQPGLGR